MKLGNNRSRVTDGFGQQNQNFIMGLTGRKSVYSTFARKLSEKLEYNTFASNGHNVRERTVTK